MNKIIRIYKCRMVLFCLSFFLFTCAAYAQPIELSDTTKGSTNLSSLNLKSVEPKFNASSSTLEQGGQYHYFKIKSVGDFEILPVIFEPAPSEMAGYSARCGLVIVSPNYPTQYLTTIGVGMTEVITCHKLTSSGVVVDKSGNQHLGLVYIAGTRNVVSSSALLVSWDGKKSRWYVNEALQDYDGDLASMWLLQKALRK